MKQRFSESFKVRKYQLHINKIKIKVIHYNISRLITTWLFLIPIGGVLQDRNINRKFIRFERTKIVIILKRCHL